MIKALVAPRLVGTHASYLPQVTPADMICLHLGYPDPTTFPADGILAATRQVFQDEGPEPLQYCEEPGEHRLRETLAAWHRVVRPAVRPSDVVVTQGTTDALEMVLKLLVEPGDTILMEAPTYLWAIRVLKYAGATMIGVPTDAEGMRIDVLESRLMELDRAGRRPKFIYTVPDYQNPAGVCLSVERRKELIRLAARHGTLVVEDNPYYDLRYRGEPRPTLFDLDDCGVVLSARTFSKTIGPGIRLGWVVGHPEVMRVFSRMKQTGSCTLTSRVVDRFIASGEFARTVARTTDLYRLKHDAMQAALERWCPAGVTWHAPSGGFYFWLNLSADCDVDALFGACQDRGVLFLKGRDFFCDGVGANALRLSLSFESAARIGDGVERLCLALAGRRRRIVG